MDAIIPVSSEVTGVAGASGALLPLPEVGVRIRPGVMGDLPFIDALQKRHSKQVGWMPRKQLEGKIAEGHVLIAEATSEGLRTKDLGPGEAAAEASWAGTKSSAVGYLIGHDQYFKRDDVGIIYQVNVLPGKQRGLIGAHLLKAQFERSAYGCRLYCCWCAQDIAANHFWEAMGFVPLAYRAGSEKKGPNGQPRVHIFWQKRIREGDTTTPWWFPAKTNAGAIREDRIVLPIAPGTHWSDAKPLVLPTADARMAIEDGRLRRTTRRPSVGNQSAPRPLEVPRNGLRFSVPLQRAAGVAKGDRQREKTPRPKVKANPRLVSAARELRDRWLEQVAADPSLVSAQGKYDVARLPGEAPESPRMLPAA